MDRRNQESERCDPGGILGLAAFIEKHHKALEADLIKYGYEIKDVGHSLSWGALHSFISNIEPDSSLSRELNPDIYKWSTTLKTNTLLADIYDILALINSNLVAIGTHKQAKIPKPYPRPSDKKDGKHIGDEAIPVTELKEMFVNKRRKRIRNG